MGPDQSFAVVLFRLLLDLGVPENAASAYLDLLAGEGEPVEEDQGALVQLDLLQRLPSGDLRAVPPRWALGALVNQRRRALADEELALAGVLEMAEDLQRAHDLRGQREGEAPLVEVLHGPHAAAHAVSVLVSSTRRSFCALQPGPTTRAKHFAEAHDLDRLRAGVSYRTIYSSTFLAEDGAVAMARELAEAGEEGRMHDAIPLPMLIMDDNVAVMPPVRDGHPSSGAAIVRSSAVVAVCQALFETLWASAAPLEAPSGGDSPLAEVASLLLIGFNDDRIAREVGASVRTVRRRIAELMALHGASSRAQLGAQLARAEAAGVALDRPLTVRDA